LPPDPFCPSKVPTMPLSTPLPTEFIHRPSHAAAQEEADERARRAEAARDLAACRELLHHGSLTFFAASLLLPRAVRESASALYAFCRIADDAVDQGGDAGAAIEGLRQRLARAYAGRPGREAADRALAAVVAVHDIPRALPEALIEGFEWDAACRRYDTLDDLLPYAARVAGTVGAMMSLMMGVRSEEGLARACDLGVAMQLSNIARDVGEDARMGRLYLPRQWMRDAGLDPDAWLAHPEFSPALAGVVQRLLTVADGLYARVDAGVAQLPRGCRPGINAARFLYAAIGHEVARQGGDSVSRRAVVPGRRKARLLLRAVLTRAAPCTGVPPPALAANRHLIDAAMRSRPPSSGATRFHPWWRLGARAGWMLDLFERVEQRRQARRQ
jgi:15-cis-phytoene synthase